MKSHPAASWVLTLFVVALISCANGRIPPSEADSVTRDREDATPHDLAIGTDDSLGDLPGDAVLDVGTVLGGGVCQYNSDCAVGICCFWEGVSILDSGGTCVDTCPPGYSCSDLSMDRENFFAFCRVAHDDCRSCDTHPNACSSDFFCVPFGTHQYCVRTCDPAEPQCLPHYTCRSTQTVLGEFRNLCVPDSGHCACEYDVDFQTDPLHCGDCETACIYPDGIPECRGGSCRLVGCDLGFVNLNGVESDGCEYECTYLSGSDPIDDEAIDSNCDGVDGYATP